MEKEYLEKLKEWERFDRQLHEALEELKEKVDDVKGEVAACKEAIEEKSKVLEEQKTEMGRFTTQLDSIREAQGMF